ncbi:MAG: hypothetical protein JWQ74_1764 [Marmoricola sp.]|nr:hypothetical protein [Marmoricola sp.]
MAIAVVGMVPLAAHADDPTPKALMQTVKVAWAGKDYNGGATAKAVIPGIGTVTMVCQRNNTMVQLTPYDRDAESDMWLAKYETKNDELVVAVKNVRVYRYSNRDDVSGSGTGANAHEGLNQHGDIENYSSGYLHGIVSQRPGRNADASDATTPPSTSFNLDWSWNGFRGAAKDSSCSMTATFVTDVTDTPAAASAAVSSAKTRKVKVGKKKRVIGRSASVVTRPSGGLSLNWHGDDDATDGQYRTDAIEGVGELQLTCGKGTNGEASLSLDPVNNNASAYVETITGEGDIDDHVDTYVIGANQGVVGPIDLPSNGMMRVYYTVGGKQSSIIVSSYRITNDDLHPELNLCEVATAPWQD